MVAAPDRAATLVENARAITAHAREMVERYRAHTGPRQQLVAETARVMVQRLGGRSHDAEWWKLIRQAFGAIVKRLPESGCQRAFFNEVTREVFGAAAHPEVEFTAPVPTRPAVKPPPVHRGPRPN